MTTIGGRYELGRELGRGATARVYEAQDRRLARRVAVKFAASPDSSPRIDREARQLAAITSEHVVPVWDVGSEADRAYFVMPVIQSTLRDVLLKGAIGLDRARQLAADLAIGLAAVHRAGLAHCDLNLSNAGLLGRRAVLLDLGQATPFGLPISLDLLRSPYLAPELHVGGPATAAADVFSLGVVLHELALRRRPGESTLPCPAELACPVARCLGEARERPQATELLRVLGGPQGPWCCGCDEALAALDAWTVDDRPAALAGATRAQAADVRWRPLRAVIDQALDFTG